MQEAGLAALACICWEKAEIQRFARSAGAADVCLAALRTRFPGHEGVTRCAQLALSRIDPEKFSGGAGVVVVPGGVIAAGGIAIAASSPSGGGDGAGSWAEVATVGVSDDEQYD